jgi:hypothetical protein
MTEIPEQKPSRGQVIWSVVQVFLGLGAGLWAITLIGNALNKPQVATATAKMDWWQYVLLGGAFILISASRYLKWRDSHKQKSKDKE